MKSKTNFLKYSVAVALAGCAGVAFALPTLQLTITGGTYQTTDETTYAGGNPFTLYALLSAPNNCNAACLAGLLADTYYISAALNPKTAPAVPPDADPSLGSFSFGGTVVAVTSDMTYGTPPLETAATQLSDPGDLASHGIFETFYRQFKFQFDGNQSTTPFNSADTTPNAIVDDDKGMYYVPFLVDVAGLADKYSIHFDLYNSKVEQCKNNNCVPDDIDINDFAPFSHDAQSLTGNGNEPDPTPAPEPGVLTLLGIGLLGLTAIRRRKA
jgi:hypothetical protein